MIRKINASMGKSVPVVEGSDRQKAPSNKEISQVDFGWANLGLCVSRSKAI